MCQAEHSALVRTFGRRSLSKPPPSSGSSMGVTVGSGGPYDYDYDGFAGKELPESRSVNDGNEEEEEEVRSCYLLLTMSR